eukprot:m.97554 g.97554  ORF g.97554 m.97554 type:complete len:324 (+) comp8828_c0_seq4:371-1342(+)
MKPLKVQLYRRRAVHRRRACTTLACRPPRGGSTTATTSSRVSPRLRSACGIVSSALPAKYSTLEIPKHSRRGEPNRCWQCGLPRRAKPLSSALRFAFSTASGTISKPMTFFARCARQRPMVPVPQQTSNTVGLCPSCSWQQSAISSNSLLAPGVLTWKKAAGEISNLRPWRFSSTVAVPRRVSYSERRGSPGTKKSSSRTSEVRLRPDSSKVLMSRFFSSRNSGSCASCPRICTAAIVCPVEGVRTSNCFQKPEWSSGAYGASGESCRKAWRVAAICFALSGTFLQFVGGTTIKLPVRNRPRRKPTAGLPSSPRAMVNSHLLR